LIPALSAAENVEAALAPLTDSPAEHHHANWGAAPGSLFGAI
jgi:hypothetical protein